MATAETVPRGHDRNSRRKPFSAFMRRLANLKNSSELGSNGVSKSKKGGQKNNPYPQSGWIGAAHPHRGAASVSITTPVSQPSLVEHSDPQSRISLPESRDDHRNVRVKSAAPTVSTKADTTHSDGQSKAGTVNTVAGALSSNGMGGAGSTFSSPAPSVRSLTTTVTTVQSAAPANALNLATAPSGPANLGSQAVHFSHQFPTSPASAIPSHVVSHPVGGHPTYNLATANNVLTDNASILTLASSSKRRRRNSLDTNASVKALAPSSVFGGSRESLPLSVLSGPLGDNSSLSAVQNRPAVGGTPAVERASIYSSSGVVPALPSERNSYYAGKQANMGDTASIRSGFAQHGRNDSLTGSIGGATSPLGGPREPGSSAKPGQTVQQPGEQEDESERSTR